MSADDRLRVHPHERLAGSVQHVNLAEAVARLRAEPHPATNGHRQIVLARQGARSIVLFAFERDAELKSHQTNGEVTIHVIAGALEITVADGPQLVGAGQFLALASGEPHAVRAVESSDMLLTVCHQAPSA